MENKRSYKKILVIYNLCKFNRKKIPEKENGCQYGRQTCKFGQCSRFLFILTEFFYGQLQNLIRTLQ